MESEVISLPDYIHAIQVVLGSVTRACRDLKLGDMRSEAAQVLVRVESIRRRLGVSAVDQCELQRVSGRSLPGRVILWLADCRQRLSARDFDSLTADVLALCLALEKTLRACWCRSRLGLESRLPCSRRIVAGGVLRAAVRLLPGRLRDNIPAEEEQDAGFRRRDAEPRGDAPRGIRLGVLRLRQFRLHDRGADGGIQRLFRRHGGP